MPFQPLRRKASSEAQSRGCAECHSPNFVLYHFTNQGGIKSANTTHGYDPKYLSKDLDFSSEAFCSFSCFELTLSRKIPQVPAACRPKRPF